jgi:hypothetical protein
MNAVEVLETLRKNTRSLPSHEQKTILDANPNLGKQILCNTLEICQILHEVWNGHYVSHDCILPFCQKRRTLEFCVRYVVLTPVRRFLFDCSVVKQKQEALK